MTELARAGAAISDGGTPSGSATSPARKRTPRRSRVPRFYAVGFWRRLLAGLVDGAIIGFTALLLAWVVGKLTGTGLPPNLGLDYWIDLLFGSDPSMVTLFIVAVATASIYLFLFHAVLGRSIGKRLIGARVIDIYGDPPTTGRAALRTVASLLSVATLGLGFLWIGFDSEKRGLHDWIAQTYVVADSSPNATERGQA